MTRARILQHAAYGQRPDGVADAQWAAMVKQALAEHLWKLQNKEAR